MADIETTLNKSESPSPPDFVTATKNYIIYLKVSMESSVSIREVKSMTELYLGALDKLIERKDS